MIQGIETYIFQHWQAIGLTSAPERIVSVKLPDRNRRDASVSLVSFKILLWQRGEEQPRFIACFPRYPKNPEAVVTFTLEKDNSRSWKIS
mgnify:CR=1 FL=1